jgi:hypothetical protein
MTSRSKPGLDITRHQEIGLELARIRDRLNTLGVEIANAYPKSSRLSRLALAMPDSVDKARSALDNQVCAEHPADPANTYVYYPRPHDRRTSDEPSAHHPQRPDHHRHGGDQDAHDQR